MLRKPASRLTLAEAALIAGIIRGPVDVLAMDHFDAARRRSFVVLQRMREEERSPRSRNRARAASGFASSRRRRCRARGTDTQRSPAAAVPQRSTAATIRPTGRSTRPSCPRCRTRPRRRCATGCAGWGVPGLQVALVALDPHDRQYACDGRRVRLRRDAIQSRRPEPAAAGLGLQAIRVRRGARTRHVAGVDGARAAAGGGQAPEGVWIPRDERASDRTR